MKLKPLISHVSIIALLSLQSPVYAMDDDFGMFDDPDIQEFVSEHDWQNTRANDITPGDIVPLINDVGGVALLQQPLYLETNPLNTRDITRNSLFVLQNPQRCGYLTSAGGSLFYNTTGEQYFTAQCTNIGSYIGINEPDFIDAINSIINKYAGNDPDIDGSLKGFQVEDIFPLLANAKIQERKLGIMFNVDRCWKRLRFHWIMPFYWFERNYFFTEQERDALEARFGATTKEEQDSFAKQHLISDKLGVGDARFYIGGQIHATDCSDVTLGAVITVPCAFALAKGLLGTVHKPLENRPEFNLEQYFEHFQGNDLSKSKIFEDITDLGLCALDQLSANVLNIPLGNQGHVGAGFFIQSEVALSRFIKRPWAEAIVMRGNIGVEYQIPGKETRFYVQTQEAINAAFAGRDFSTSDEPQATDNLLFLQQELINRLFPFTFNTAVNPGIFFRYTSSMNYDKPCWGIRVGSDFWYRTKEHLGHIDAPQELLQTLDVEKATRPRAYQSNLHLTTYWKRQHERHDLIISLILDGTYFGEGVGHAFTLGLKLESNF